jgi:type II secretory pathway pseudopilin PulG
MRKAFTMIELIFIMIVIGILAATMAMNMPDNRLLMDRDFITQKIKQKHIYALSYDNYDYKNKRFIDSTTCIYINKESINKEEKDKSRSKLYKISSQTTISPNDLNICFDNLGRPYKLNNLLNMPIELNITYKNKTKTVNIMPFSGTIVKE